MAVPDITLSKGQILATPSAISEIGMVVQTPGYMFGHVAAVYQTADGAAVNQSVLFKESDAVVVKYGSTVYYLMSEENIAFTENLPE